MRWNKKSSSQSRVVDVVVVNEHPLSVVLPLFTPMTFAMKYFIGIETEEVSRLVEYSYNGTRRNKNKKLSQPMTIINVYDQFSVYVHYLCMITCFHIYFPRQYQFQQLLRIISVTIIITKEATQNVTP